MVMSVPRLLHALCTLVAITLAVGCGSDDGGGGTGPAPTGNLTVTVSPPPEGAATVHVTGPAGYSHSLSATTTLEGLPVGSYAITADSVTSQDSIVGAKVYKGLVTVSPVNVSKGSNARSTVTYPLSYQTGALWFVSAGVELVGSLSAPLLRDTNLVTSLTRAAAHVPQGLAFDASGLMWVSAMGEDTLRSFSVAQRGAGGTIAATTMLQSAALMIPQGMVFDKNGTLWVTDDLNELLGFSAAQLAAGGNGITPAFHITDTLTTNPGMQGVAFDSAGNAWIAETLVGQVVEYTAAQLATSGRTAPNIRLTSNMSAPVDLAFDSHGDLWVANESLGVTGYQPSQIAVTGSPTPHFAAIDVIDEPRGIAFDHSGSLYVFNQNGGFISVYSAASIESGSPMLERNLQPNFGDPEYLGADKLAFDRWVVEPIVAGAVTQNRVQQIAKPRAH
jgi:sugar lactone lactonase YvrE